jgi:YD repeat-containing protein
MKIYITRFRRNIKWTAGGCALALAVMMPNRIAHTDSYEYDSANRLTAVTYDSGKRISFTYDVNGNMLNRSVSDSSAGNGVTAGTLTDSWVDFSYPGEELGTSPKPFDTSDEGIIALVPDGGGTLHIKAGTSSETMTILKPMTIQAEGGLARIGVSP